MAKNPRKKFCTPGGLGFNHFRTAGEAHLEYLNSKKSCDVTFLVGEGRKEIQCHKFCLISRSPVFERMFSETWNESKSKNPVILDDGQPEAFSAFLDFLYADKMTTSYPMAVQLLQLGDKYDVKPLVDECEQLLRDNLGLRNAIQVFNVAQLCSLNKLMEEAEDFMIGSFIELSNDPSFKEMDEETLAYLLKKDDLGLPECDLFRIVLSWASGKVGESAEKNCSYGNVLKKVIPLIRFPLMSVEEFSIRVMPAHFCHNVLSHEEIRELYEYFYAEGSNRVERARTIKFSAKPRKEPLRVDFYYKVNESGLESEFQRLYEILAYQLSYEETLEVTVSNPKGLRLSSILIHGPNLDLLQQYCPLSQAPPSVYKVRVYVDADLGGVGSSVVILERDCVITKGVESEIQVEPYIRLSDGRKFRIRVRFQDSTVVFINSTGNQNRIWGINFDTLTRSRLRTQCRPVGGGTLNLTLILGPRWSRCLHIVRGLKLI